MKADALLVYRNGKAPTTAELLAQIQRMYVNFTRIEEIRYTPYL